METVHQDFAAKGVKFYYVYKSLAHPENSGYVQPFNLKERLMHVAEAKRTLGTKMPWVCDTMDNELKHALGDRPNSEFVIDPDGKIVIARSWSSPSQLRTDLAKLVGAVDKPTRVEDLDMKKQPPKSKPKSGVVKRVSLSGTTTPLKIDPIETPGTPHYAKLRVESSGSRLYLGFFLDPLYNVHWNNKAKPLEFTIEAPDGLTLSPEFGTAAKVDVDADNDPREFLIDAWGNTNPDGKLKVTVRYFACDDAETFCIPVTQQYIVSQERDQDGGSRRSSTGRPGGQRGRGRQPGQGRPGQGRGGQRPGGQPRGAR